MPKDFPNLTILAYAAATFMLIAGAGVAWKRTAAWAGMALALYFGIVVWLVMNGRVLLAHPTEYVAYSGPAAQLAIAMAGLIVYATYARIDGASAFRLTRAARIVIGVCVILFGIAHFIYMNMTAPLVPKWLPPGQEFWGVTQPAWHRSPRALRSSPAWRRRVQRHRWPRRAAMRRLPACATASWRCRRCFCGLRCTTRWLAVRSGKTWTHTTRRDGRAARV